MIKEKAEEFLKALGNPYDTGTVQEIPFTVIAVMDNSFLPAPLSIATSIGTMPDDSIRRMMIKSFIEVAGAKGVLVLSEAKMARTDKPPSELSSDEKEKLESEAVDVVLCAAEDFDTISLHTAELVRNEDGNVVNMKDWEMRGSKNKSENAERMGPLTDLMPTRDEVKAAQDRIKIRNEAKKLEAVLEDTTTCDQCDREMTQKQHQLNKGLCNRCIEGIQ